MKRLSVLLFILLAACQPTPAEEAVVNKAEGRLEAQIAETKPVEVYAVEAGEGAPPAGASGAEPANTLRNVLGAPAHLSDTVFGRVYGGTMDVKIDADVAVPAVSTVPVYRVALGGFSTAEKEQIAKALLGEGPYIYRQNPRAWNESNIRYYQSWLNALDERPYGPNADYTELREWLAGQIEAHQRAYQQADSRVKEQPWPGQWSDTNGAVMSEDGRTFSWSDGGLLKYERRGTPWYLQDQYRPSPRTDEERAADQVAVSFLSILHDVPVQLHGIAAHDESWRQRFGVETGFENGAYLLRYLPTYGGIPIYPWETYHGTDNGMQDAGVPFDRNARQERIEAVTDHGEVVEATWTSPVRVLGVENENVSLLPFEKVLDIFKQQVFMNIYIGKDYQGNDSHTDMHITEITFSYMRVRRPSEADYWLLPVWDFRGYDSRWHDHIDTWWDNFSILTVNAIDGSIVDRNVGY